ncbi:type I restriction endonuclease [Enterococcus sp. E4-79]|uniref:type I restriction endonuclease n=1 Tax=Enterococcus TaxID=1350 RepID=UPI0019F69EC0|nr:MULTISPECIES: type I restriction endonuclease [Enterococcus]EGP5096667.1 endonuclease [Enterococcus faecium]EGP5468627.1 endonuclease [Enterococcus faecium]EGP5491963.1 endonuclease [Enterococcus faecium]EGP5737274.1 endonuclease [Enterococcus faecium]EME7122035.1 type I restriction enzyme HsdR N-terminal domain-containing protein [Enterococcus faecium]
MELEKFQDTLKQLGKRVVELKDSIGTEEATKTSLIMPFFAALGYDLFNPTEFVPEFTADVGIKKGEKVDYAIVLEGQPTILIEAKSINEQLTKHDSQLFRYFGTTVSKFGILTNGEEYKFFTDLDEPNKMDLTPFLTVNITKIKDSQIPELAKFHKDNFDVDKITSSAAELKYLNSLKNYLSSELIDPTEDFVKYLLTEIYDGMKTKQTVEKFKPIIKKGLNQFIAERVNDKLSAALKTSVTVEDNETKSESNTTDETDSEIVTTPEELEAYTICKVVLKDTIPLDRLFYRDNRSYFNILLDDNIRKWILRVRFNTNGMKIELNDENHTVYELNEPIDIYNYSSQIIDVVNKFL